jgi:hypothetical protein
VPRRLATGRPGVAPFSNGALDAVTAATGTALIDTCTITRPDPNADPVLNEETGTYEPVTVEVYSGPCLFGRDTEDASTTAVGEESVPLSRIHLYLPLATTDLAEQDDVTCDTSHDPRLAGRAFTLIDVTVDSTEPFRAVLIQEAL